MPSAAAAAAAAAVAIVFVIAGRTQVMSVLPFVTARSSRETRDPERRKIYRGRGLFSISHNRERSIYRTCMYTGTNLHTIFCFGLHIFLC